jgi:hypothetical protein
MAIGKLLDYRNTGISIMGSDISARTNPSPVFFISKDALFPYIN